MAISKKDPKKVRAGKLGGQKSGANFKRNRKAASLAGQKSAWKRHGSTLDQFGLKQGNVVNE